ncbi:MAG: MFS transporter [Phycisphaerales bacterium]|nr:MFS transporter [Phycisphaerae bacterium]NNF41814.1 MFS transporter [Phycisphaerales bacterium]NNM26668.1 MFS transporter [Phycisphaerales bacterium]
MTSAPVIANPVPRTAWLRLGTIIGAHPIVDAYSGFVPPLLGVLQVRCDLTGWQTASLLSIGPLTSGLCQPVFAWLSDRIDSRFFGPAGLALAAACLSSIGLATSFPALVVLFGLGMLGVGAFHPVGAASVGQLAGRRRAAGVTVFFVAGMLGATVGPVISSRVTAIEPDGFTWLRWAMVPGLLAAVVLHLAMARVSHRADDHHTLRFEPSEIRQRWWTTTLLCAGNALRFSVNIALFYIYVWWAQAVVAGEGVAGDEIVRVAAIFCGELNALTMLGMGLGGLVAGTLVRRGRERWWFIVVPLAFAPLIALFPTAGRGGGYLLALLAGVGFAAVIPISIATAQRLLPHRTSLASSLMMGGPWAISALAPPGAEWLIARAGLGAAFSVAAILLALSGILGLLLPGVLLRRLD